MMMAIAIIIIIIILIIIIIIIVIIVARLKMVWRFVQSLVDATNDGFLWEQWEYTGWWWWDWYGGGGWWWSGWWWTEGWTRWTCEIAGDGPVWGGA